MKYLTIEGKQVQVCEGCNTPFPTQDKVAPFGYVSPDSPEMRPTVVLGIPGVENVARNVCIECYRKDFAKIYQGKECPI